MTFKIEKGIPLAESHYGRRLSYPFNLMKVGDSFFVPLSGKLYPSDGRDTADRRVRNASLSYAKTHNIKFTVRSVKGGVRCWRIK